VSGGKPPESWEELLQQGPVNPRKLTYYRRQEVEYLLSLPKRPHILLTHDWPIPGDHHAVGEQPHYKLLTELEPCWAFAGHMHRYREENVERSRFVGLHGMDGPVNEWCIVMKWDGATLERCP
jgi:hypothetical protein